jgi:membrane fusion protein, multidrug efflux system
MTEPQTGDAPISAPLLKAPPPRRRPVWRTILWIALVVAVAVGVAVLLTPHGGSHGGGRGGGSGRRPPTVIGVATAQKGDIPIQLDALGTVTPEATVTVRTRIAGQLMKVYFREGQMVRAGELLAEVDPRPYAVVVQQAEGQLIHDQAALTQAELDLKRYQTLAAQDSIARQQVDTQAATVRQDQGTVRSDQASLASARLNLAYCRITAPTAGRVGLRQVDAGNYVTTSDTNGLVVITQLDPIDVVFTLPEDNVPQVAARLAAGASLPAVAFDRTGATALAQGVLATLDNQVDTTTGTVKAKARFANAGAALFPSQFVNLRMTVDILKDAVIVPTQAIRHGPKGDYVYEVQPDQTAKVVLVKVGPAQGERTAITSGVAVGDQVITDGGDRLSDGARVILPGQAPPAMGARSGQKSGLFGWIAGLFGKTPASDQDRAAGGFSGAGGGVSTGGAPGGQGGGRMQAMVAGLGLDAGQQAKAQAIFADMREKMAAAGDDSDARSAARREAMAKLEAILRPDQKARFEPLRAGVRPGGAPAQAPASPEAPAAAPAAAGPPVASPPPARPAAATGGGQGGGPGGGGRMAMMTEVLGLDAGQQAKAQAIFAEARQKAEASDDPDARQAARREAMAKLDAILRPDQKAKLQALRAQRGAQGGGE